MRGFGHVVFGWEDFKGNSIKFIPVVLDFKLTQIP